METLRGFFFDGKISLARPAEANMDGARIVITHADGAAEYDAASAISPPAPTAETFFIEFPDGAKFESAGDGMAPGFDRDPQRGLERYWRAASAGVAIIGIATLLFFWKGITAIAAAWAPHLPKSATQDASGMAQKLFGSLDDMYRSHDPELMEAFEQMRAAHPELDLKIKLCCENQASNAFALPDGHVVLGRSLMKELTSDQRTAVMFHEVGHLRHYHPQRAFIENRFLTGALLVVAGYGEALGWGLVLAGAAHSREQEKEADLFAAAELVKRGKSPLLLAEALEAMEREEGRAKNRGGWRVSHPPTPERREYLQAVTPLEASTENVGEVSDLPESEKTEDQE